MFSFIHPMITFAILPDSCTVFTIYLNDKYIIVGLWCILEQNCMSCCCSFYKVIDVLFTHLEIAYKITC